MPTPDDFEASDDLEAADSQKLPLSEASRDALRRRMTFQAEASLSYNSPLPPPEILAGYSRLQADAPERILAMVERQEAHRQQIEKTVVEAGAANASKGINVTAYLATLFVGASLYMVHEHYAVYGIVTLGSTLAALAGANLYGKSSQQKERTEKAKILTESDQSRQNRRQLSGSKPPSDRTTRPNYYLNGGILPYVLRQLLEEDTIAAGHLLDTLQPRRLSAATGKPRAVWRGAFLVPLYVKWRTV